MNDTPGMIQRHAQQPGDWTPPALYNDRMPGEDQITLEEGVAAMIHGAADDDGRISEECAAELGRRIVLTLLQRARPDLFRDVCEDAAPPLPVSHPEQRTAIVALDFSDAAYDDHRLAENIARALAAECRSGNGLADEACEGHTRTITVYLNDASHTERP